MKKFIVSCIYSATIQVEVEAEGEWEAIKKARQERSNLYDSDFQGWSKSIIDNIEPWEDEDTAEGLENEEVT